MRPQIDQFFKSLAARLTRLYICVTVDPCAVIGLAGHVSMSDATQPNILMLI